MQICPSTIKLPKLVWSFAIFLNPQKLPKTIKISPNLVTLTVAPIWEDLVKTCLDKNWLKTGNFLTGIFWPQNSMGHYLVRRRLNELCSYESKLANIVQRTITSLRLTSCLTSLDLTKQAKLLLIQQRQSS